MIGENIKISLPKDSDQHRDGDPPRHGGRLQNFYHPKGWLLNFGSIETIVSTKNQIEQSVSFFVRLCVNLWIIELLTQLKILF